MVQEEILLTPAPLEDIRPDYDHAPFMALNNSVITRELKRSPNKGWTLTFNVLSTEYSRGQTIFLLNSDANKGYGININAALVNQFGGEGLVLIQKLDISDVTDPKWSDYQQGEKLSRSDESGHPVTGYAVVAENRNQDDARYDTSEWLGFAKVEFRWKKSSGELSAYVNGELLTSAIDKDFDQFDLICIQGNKTGYFDEIVVTSE